ncbi:flagellar basal-body MS-ring/collar protein FliF [Stakelama marina]|uniref:Flagellar M-ring protein n=1 Tax=Stakelama marina TaxID=2826939 RepID=A0A8T4I8E4_9SPHN|nr:flagellar basal-body MS-ring/collar protein FliF [Stakelama marina]MBR0550937.1 flagellar M-ring protein FliF [Stakelama marina]
MGGVALTLLVALAAVAMSGGSSDRMGYLYTDLDPSAAQSITEKLRAQNVPFSLSGDGTAILAPEDRLPELRMSMAGEQLGGKIGYEVLDEQQPFGISSSREKMNETRAIEGELSRSIATLQNIANARVHIVMPERALFAAEKRKASAAVTVKTRGRLSQENVEAIRYLVAAAVPELSPESISIVDQTGALLARAGEVGEIGASQADERKVAIESRIRHQVESLLEPIVGVGKVRAEVAADIDRDQTREEAQVYDPDNQVIARQVTVESGDQSRENQAGAQGATVAAQLPEGQGQIDGNGGDTRESARNENSEDTTYQNSSRHTVTVRTPGQIKRLTVAVMVDGGDKDLPAEQTQRLTRLVENAVGYDADRGDSVIVESMAFAQPGEIADAEGGLLSNLPVDQLFGIGKLLLIAAVGLIVLRMLKPKAAPADAAGLIAGPDGQPITLTPQSGEAGEAGEGGGQAAIEGPQLDDEIALAQVEGNIKASALKKIGEAITGSPAESASVIRQWMNA